ncbi:MAG: hypothetical protein Q4G62_04805 [Pseudomonadota bacterium]|nr:hypothetical protein [Pseudomonadota bacterium]
MENHKMLNELYAMMMAHEASNPAYAHLSSEVYGRLRRTYADDDVLEASIAAEKQQDAALRAVA